MKPKFLETKVKTETMERWRESFAEVKAPDLSRLLQLGGDSRKDGKQ